MSRFASGGLAAVGLAATISFSASSPGLAGGDVPGNPHGVQPLLIGAEVPALKLKAADGSDVDLAVAAAKTPTMVIFYRRGW